MDNSELLGVFVLRNRKRPETMPVHNESGLWKAWHMPDGNIMLQPLTWDCEPWGSFYMMPQEDFTDLLTPVSPTENARGYDFIVPSVRSDAPDLLEMWYEKALKAHDGLLPGSLISGRVVMVDGKEQDGEGQVSMASGELLLRPMEHPDDLLGEADKTPLPAMRRAQPAPSPARSGATASGAGGESRAAQPAPRPQSPRPAAPQSSASATAAAVPPRPAQQLPDQHHPDKTRQAVAAGVEAALPKAPQKTARAEPIRAVVAAAVAPARPAAVSPPLEIGIEKEEHEGPAPAKSAAAAPPAKPATSVQSGRHSLAREMQAKRMEDHMREEFAKLLDRMSDTPDQDLDARMLRLLDMGTEFTWKQKFMFTEFGLALRKKRKRTLALKAHLRALAVSPGDEHVLFNIARSEYELGQASAAIEHLHDALAAAPDFQAAVDFLNFLRGKTPKS